MPQVRPCLSALVVNGTSCRHRQLYPGQVRPMPTDPLPLSELVCVTCGRPIEARANRVRPYLHVLADDDPLVDADDETFRAALDHVVRPVN